MTKGINQWTRILIGGWRELTRRWRIMLITALIGASALTSIIQWFGMHWVHDHWGEYGHYALEIVIYGVLGPLLFLLFASSIFFRWRMERERAEQQLAAVVEGSADAIVSVDAQRRIRSWNRGAETLFGYGAEEALGEAFERLLGPSLRWPANASRWETVMRARDGRQIPVEVSCSLLAEEVGEGPMRVLIIRDVTERKRREQAVQDERARIARELHDGVQQDLFLLGIKLDICHQLLRSDPDRAAQELLSVRETLQEEISNVQRIVRALRPIQLERFGFVSALRRLAAEFAQQHPCAVDFSLQGPERELPYEVESTLFRIAQEALNNVAKHAQAQRVWLQLDLTDPQGVTMTIRDDGRGFDGHPGITQPVRSAGLGLKHIRERVEQQGGTFTLDSAAGRGTTLTLTIPLPSGV